MPGNATFYETHYGSYPRRSDRFFETICIILGAVHRNFQTQLKRNFILYAKSLDALANHLALQLVVSNWLLVLATMLHLNYSLIHINPDFIQDLIYNLLRFFFIFFILHGIIDSIVHYILFHIHHFTLLRELIHYLRYLW